VHVAGPGGCPGTTLHSSATNLTADIGSSDKPLPGPPPARPPGFSKAPPARFRRSHETGCGANAAGIAYAPGSATPNLDALEEAVFWTSREKVWAEQDAAAEAALVAELKAERVAAANALTDDEFQRPFLRRVERSSGWLASTSPGSRGAAWPGQTPTPLDFVCLRPDASLSVAGRCPPALSLWNVQHGSAQVCDPVAGDPPRPVGRSMRPAVSREVKHRPRTLMETDSWTLSCTSWKCHESL
jgi:hypothetical protein